LRIETDRFFKGQEGDNESDDFGKTKRRQARSQSGNRDKGGVHQTIPPQTQSPESVMQQKKIDELEE
jgi:Fic family protein